MPREWEPFALALDRLREDLEAAYQQYLVDPRRWRNETNSAARADWAIRRAIAFDRYHTTVGNRPR
jgi:hypothetical protein